MTNYYEILEIDPRADVVAIAEVISEKRRLWQSRTSHPRLEIRQRAEKMMKDISDAETILENASKREEYDRQLATQTKPPAGASYAQEEAEVEPLQFDINEPWTSTHRRLEQLEALINQAEKLMADRGQLTSEPEPAFHPYWGAKQFCIAAFVSVTAVGVTGFLVVLTVFFLSALSRSDEIAFLVTMGVAVISHIPVGLMIAGIFVSRRNLRARRENHRIAARHQVLLTEKLAHTRGEVLNVDCTLHALAREYCGAYVDWINPDMLSPWYLRQLREILALPGVQNWDVAENIYYDRRLSSNNSNYRSPGEDDRAGQMAAVLEYYSTWVHDACQP